MTFKTVEAFTAELDDVSDVSILDHVAAKDPLCALIIELLGENESHDHTARAPLPTWQEFENRMEKEGIRAFLRNGQLNVFLPFIPAEWQIEGWELDGFHEAHNTVEAYSTEYNPSDSQTVVLQMIAGDGFACRLTMMFEHITTSNIALIEWVEGEQAHVEAQVVAWTEQDRSAAVDTARTAINAMPRQHWHSAIEELRTSLCISGQSPYQSIASIIEINSDWLEAGERELLLGILDRARQRAGETLVELAPVSGRFWNLRQMIRDCELPSEETNEERMYIRLPPFDIGIKRESEGVVVDIWGSDKVGLESLASTYAFFSDADPGEEDA